MSGRNVKVDLDSPGVLEEMIQWETMRDPSFSRERDREKQEEAIAQAEFQRAVAGLVQIRKKRELTAQYVARVLGVTQPYVSQVESGKKAVGLGFLIKYSRAVGAELRVREKRGWKKGDADTGGQKTTRRRK